MDTYPGSPLQPSTSNQSDGFNDAASQASTLATSERINSNERERWSRKVRKVIIPLSATLLGAPLITLIVLLSLHNKTPQGPYGCDPRGKVWIYGVHSNHSISMWNPLYALDINLWFGRYSLREARAIDVSWDLFVGRGLQAVAAVIVYFCFRIVMTDAIMNEPLTHEEILAVQYSTTAPTSFWVYYKACMRNRRSGSRRCFHRAVLLVVSALYVLLTPTWLSAMTGYQTLMVPWLLDGTKSISFHDMHSCFVGIADASRIGLKNNTCVHSDTPLAHAVRNYARTPSCLECYPHGNDHDHYIWTSNGQTFVRGHASFEQRQNCEHPSSFEWPLGNIRPLLSPVLRIEGGTYYYEDRNTQKNTTFLGSYLLEKGVCQIDQGYYTWGFSFIMLFTFTVTTFVLSALWSIAMYRCCSKLWPQQVDMVFGDLRTAILVARAIQDEIGKDADNMPDNALQQALDRINARLLLDHVGTDMVPRPRPERRRPRSNEYAVGSERYRAYLQMGYNGHSHDNPTAGDRYYLLSP